MGIDTVSVGTCVLSGTNMTEIPIIGGRIRVFCVTCPAINFMEDYIYITSSLEGIKDGLGKNVYLQVGKEATHSTKKR
jgi:hypothetical protein